MGPTHHTLAWPLPSPCPTAQLGCKSPGSSWLAKYGGITLQAAGTTEATLGCGNPPGMQSVWPKGLSWTLLPASSLCSCLPFHSPSVCGVHKGAHLFCPGHGNGAQSDKKKKTEVTNKTSKGKIQEGEHLRLLMTYVGSTSKHESH